MPVECKIVTCCDLDDFPQNSSSAGNCPMGWQWNGSSCVRCAILAAPSLTVSANIIDVEFDVEADSAYRVERFEAGHWMTLSTGTGTGAIELYSDESVEAGTHYSYRISVAVSEECGYIEGESASAVAV